MGVVGQMQLDQALRLGIEPMAGITLKGMSFCLTIASRLSLLVYVDGMNTAWFESLQDYCGRRNRVMPPFAYVLGAVFDLSTRVERGFITPALLWAGIERYAQEQRGAAVERQAAALPHGRRAAKRRVPADVARRMRELFGPPGTGKGARETDRDRAHPG